MATQVDAQAVPGSQPGRTERTPGGKLLLALLIGFLLAIPLFSIYLLNWDRQSQSETARSSIVAGWGGPQVIAGPLLAIPYQAQVSETVEEGGRQVVYSSMVWRELLLSPEAAALEADIAPKPVRRSIYEAVVYETRLQGVARFVLPPDLERIGVPAGDLVFARAELRFGLSDARGLFGVPPQVKADGRPLRLEPGHGPAVTGNSGFYTPVDAMSLLAKPLVATFDYAFRGNGSLTLAPRAGDTRWAVRSSWPNPSFSGAFLPVSRTVTSEGFSASYRVGNLALGQSLVNSVDAPIGQVVTNGLSAGAPDPGLPGAMTIDLIQPVNLYSQVERATKYGFLFIGFTFAALLMFDVIGGVRVSTVEYLLVGAALILFFVLVLAFAEVIGFAIAYAVASAAIVGLITAYTAAVLKSWRRASYIGALLVGLYAVLYILLSLEAYALLIGALMLFAALAGVMYATRNLDWGSARTRP